MVGATLALLLARQADAKGPRIIVVEPQPFRSGDSLNPSFDQRSTALSLSSVAVLEKAGVWPQLQPQACAIDSIHVSDRGHFGSTLMQASEEKLPTLGHVIENRRLGQALLMAQSAWPAIHWQTAQADAVTLDAEAATVHLHGDGGEQSLRSRLLIVADGAESALRESLGVSVQRIDYGQHALIATVATEKPHRGRAFERFTDTGPLALLPLPDAEGFHRSALIWTQPDHRVEALLVLDEPAFLAKLQERFGWRLGRFLKAGQRHSYPLQRSLAREQSQPRVVIAGNAAHALHPVAGQGFNLALRDAAVLSQLLLQAWQRGEDIGALPVLQRYVDLQTDDQQRTADASEQLTRLFGSRNPLLAGLRNAGLLAFDSLPALKSAFVREATGIGRHHPDWKLRP